MSSLKTNYVNLDTLYSTVGSGDRNISDRFSELQHATDADITSNNNPADSLMEATDTERNRSKRFGDNDDATPLCPSLPFKMRLIGFLICAGVGFLFGIFSWVTAFTKGGGTFAVIYTFSNLFMIGSTLFLCGPLRQLKNLLRPTRLIAVLLFVVMMILTYVFALAVKVPWATIITVIVQLLAMAWYALSYLPFARDAIRSWCSCCCRR